MSIHRNDIIAVLSSIAAAASIATSLGLGDSVDALAPGYGKKLLAIITLVSVIAATLSRVLSNPSPIAVASVQDKTTQTAVAVPVTPAELTLPKGS